MSSAPRRIAALALLLLAASCRRDDVRGLDGQPEIPPELDFGLLAVGARKTLALPIENRGLVDVALGDVQTIEPFDVSQLPDPIGGGSQKSALVSFSPSAPGELEGEITIATTSTRVPYLTLRVHGTAYSPTLVAAPDRLDFGDVDVGAAKSLTLTIRNTSPVALTPAIESQDGVQFAVSPAGELGSLDPGQSTDVTVTFAPNAAGERTTFLQLSCPVCSTTNIYARGNGIPRPVPTTCALSVDKDRLDFGPLDPGQTQNGTVTVSSIGDGTCHMQLPYFAAGSDPAFLGTFHAQELAPGQSTSLRVDFAPKAATPLRTTGSLVIVSNDVSHDGPISISLGANVNEPPPPPPPAGKLEVTPLALTFSAQAPNAPASQAVTLRNSGGTALTWTATDDDTLMHLAETTGTLQPGQSANVGVSVDAQATAGARDRHIVFDSGTTGNATVAVHIDFSAAPPPPPPPGSLTVTPLALAFSAEIPNAPAPKAFTVGNKGGQDLTWTAVPDDEGVTVTPASGTIHAGGSLFANVAVAAQSVIGTRTAHVQVDAGAAGSATVTLTIEFKQTTPPPPPPQYGSSVWPKFHHDNGNTGLSQIDTSKNKGVARKVKLSLPPGCKLLYGFWRCGTYQASPSLAADGSIYQLGGDGDVYAVDDTSMKVKWSLPIGVPMLASAESDITVVASKHFFIHSHGDGADTPQFFKVLDQGKTGVISWKNTPAGYDSNGKRLDGFDSAPAIDYDGNLYLMNEDASKVGTWDQRSVKLFDLALSPKTLNNFTHGAALTTDRIAFWTSGGSIWALDEVGKKVAWSAQDAAAVPSLVQFAKNAPMITNTGAVISAFGWRTGTSASNFKCSTRITAFSATKVKKQLWSTLIGPTNCVRGLAPRNANVNNDEEVRYNLGVSSPAMGPDGTIYIGHADGLYAIDASKHSVKWAYGTASVVSSPAVGADGTVYFGSMDGYIRAVSKTGTLKWSVKTGGQVNSSPAIGVDGTVYAMSDDGYLYAVK